jgi:hypothetical protein
MTLARLQELIRLKERPETTLSLEAAIQQGEQTVARYRFTPSIRGLLQRDFIACGERSGPRILDTGGVW